MLTHAASIARAPAARASAIRLTSKVFSRNIVVGRDGRHFNSIILMVPQAEEWQIERFGRYNRTATPGLTFALPLVDKVAYKRTIKETTIPIHPQTAITKDNVHVQLDGAVYTKVADTYKASYGIEDPEIAISVLAQSAMRKEVGNLELDREFRGFKPRTSGFLPRCLRSCH